MGEAEERRYSDHEFRRILDEAARSEEVAGRAPEVAPSVSRDGLTLSEIQAIAREVLIDPAAVERAARTLPDPRMIHVPSEPTGPFPRVIRGELTIGRALSDPEMRMVALEGERASGRRGRIRRSVDAAEWRDEEDRFSIRVVRGETATRVSVTFDQSAELVGGSAVLAGGGLVATGVVAATAAAPLLLAAVPLLVGGTIGLIWLNAVGRNAATRERLRELLVQLDEAVRPG